MRKRAVRSVALGGLVLGLTLIAPLAQASSPNTPTCPAFSSKSFHHPTRIDNPYFPLVPGTRFTYKGNLKKQAVVDVVYVTHNTPTISGVATVEVRDQVYA